MDHRTIGEGQYRFTLDRGSLRRHATAFQLRHWWRWVLSFVVLSLMATAVAGILLHLGSAMRLPRDSQTLWTFSASAGVVFTLCLLAEKARKTTEGSTTFIGKSWTCTLTEDHWIIEDDEGVRTQIPWHVMKIEFESEHAWNVSCGAQQLVIYRQPLREANLESEFLSRIATGK
jgi:hypothetical protein